jgi:hypothetical protein
MKNDWNGFFCWIMDADFSFEASVFLFDILIRIRLFKIRIRVYLKSYYFRCYPIVVYLKSTFLLLIDE